MTSRFKQILMTGEDLPGFTISSALIKPEKVRLCWFFSELIVTDPGELSQLISTLTSLLRRWEKMRAEAIVADAMATDRGRSDDGSRPLGGPDTGRGGNPHPGR